MRHSTIGLTLVLSLLMFIGCEQQPTTSSDPVDTTGSGSHAGMSEWKCGTYNGHQLYTGPKGGCYYYNSSGNKSYVDRSNCNC